MKKPELNNYSDTPVNLELLHHDWQEYLSHKEKELQRLRNYCTLTFGESHPEIKKCVHEVEIEKLREALEVISVLSVNNNKDIYETAEQALGESDE